MGTTHRRSMGVQELGAMSSFLATVVLGAWLLPGAWLSGLVVGLGIGLVVAAAVHLHATRPPTGPLPGVSGQLPPEPGTEPVTSVVAGTERTTARAGRPD